MISIKKRNYALKYLNVLLTVYVRIKNTYIDELYKEFT